MSRIEQALRWAAGELGRKQQRWALIGGLAVSARTEPRFTRDVDLVVSVTDDVEAEALGFELQRRGAVVHATVEQEGTGRLATLRLSPPGEARQGIVIDLLFASSGVEPEIVDVAEPLEVLPGLSVPVARVGHLLALKVLARNDATRPQDAADIRALLEVVDDPERERARVAVRLMAERGTDRGRDVVRLLEEALGSAPHP